MRDLSRSDMARPSFQTKLSELDRGTISRVASSEVIPTVSGVGALLSRDRNVDLGYRPEPT